MQTTVSGLEANVATLEDKLAKEKQHSGARRAIYHSGAPPSPVSGSSGGGGAGGEEDGAPGGAGVLVMTEEEEIRADLHTQVRPFVNPSLISILSRCSPFVIPSPYLIPI